MVGPLAPMRTAVGGGVMWCREVGMCSCVQSGRLPGEESGVYPKSSWLQQLRF